MNRLSHSRRLVFGLALGMISGCTSASEVPTATAELWAGDIITEGNVTTVFNESGSVWGGTARLVEEASIGVEAGDDPYMLGRVRSVAAGNDRMYVVDDQVPAVRVYDWQGRWLHDLGREGQGPGEFQAPSGVAVDAEGRVWVHEQVMTRLMVFSPDGEVLHTHNLGGMRISGNNSSMTLAADGRAYVYDVVFPEDPAAAAERRLLMKPFDAEGNAGDPIDMPQFDNPATLEAFSNIGAVRFTGVPFHPTGRSVFTPDAIVVSGYPDPYRFEMLHPDGHRTIVERPWEPIEVRPEEADAYRRAATEYMRGMDPEWTWSGPEIPPTKAAYTDLVPTASGEVWVARPGRGSPVPGCEPDPDEVSSTPPCWQEERLIDVFGADGRYLGALDAPEALSLRPPPFIRGNDVIAMVENEAGTIMVKRYRLVLPGEK